MVIVLDDAVFTVRQLPPVIVMSQVTASPLINVVEVYVLDAPLCTLIPLILKLKFTEPLPVLDGLAVNVTEEPVQIITPGLAVIVISGVRIGFTATAKVLVALLNSQPLNAVTDTFPEVAPKFTTILVSPCPEVIIAPGGTV